MPRATRSCSLIATLMVAAAIGLAAPAAAEPAPGTVVVRPGDTLSVIAARAGVSTAALAAANGLTTPNLIVVGRLLQLPVGGASSGVTHVVKPGDTLSGIAAAHGVSVGALARANGIGNANLIVIGRRLTIPGAAAASTGAGTGVPAPLAADPGRLTLAPLFDRWAAEYGVPADLAKALAWMESGWQNHVVSSTGAMGVGQLMPDTVVVARRLAGAPSLDPRVAEDNIRLSIRFLRYLLDSTGDTGMAVAAYYQGLNGIRRDDVQPGTAHYVEAVLALRSRFV